MRHSKISAVVLFALLLGIFGTSFSVPSSAPIPGAVLSVLDVEEAAAYDCTLTALVPYTGSVQAAAQGGTSNCRSGSGMLVTVCLQQGGTNAVCSSYNSPWVSSVSRSPFCSYKSWLTGPANYRTVTSVWYGGTLIQQKASAYAYYSKRCI